MNLVEELRSILSEAKPGGEVLYFIHTVYETPSGEKKTSKDSWLAKWGKPSKANLEKVAGKFSDGKVISAKLQRANGDVVATLGEQTENLYEARKKKRKVEDLVPLSRRGLNEVVTAMVSKLSAELTAPRSDDPETIAKLRAIVANHTAAKVGGVMVDTFSASAAVQVYDALSDANKAHMGAMPIRRMMELVFRMLAKRVA